MCAVSTVGRLNRKGMEACRKGEFDIAELNLHEALELARKSGCTCTEVKLHNNLGTVYELQGRFKRALSHYEEALEAIKGKTPMTHPLYARLTRSMARVSFSCRASASCNR